KQGTLELVWTFPVRDGEVLAGKVLAALALYLALLAATVTGPALLYALHPFAVAPVVAGYVGLVLLGIAFVACGAAASTVSENQVVSAMLTYGILVFAWFATWNEAAIGARIPSAASRSRPTRARSSAVSPATCASRSSTRARRVRCGAR